MKYLNTFLESVRHGVYPWFSINKKTFKISYGEADNDLAADAFFEYLEEDEYGMCREDWSMGMRDQAAEQAVEMIKQGKSNKELDEEFGDWYEK